MNQRRASREHRCLRCKLNEKLCICEHFVELQSNTHVSLIVHVRELTLTSNTAYFVNQLLPKTSDISIRGSMNFQFNPAQILTDNPQTFYLFPDDDSIELNDDFKAKFPGPYHLIVPDGSWSQAKKFKKREKLLTPIQSVRLPKNIEGRYKLRVSPVEGGLSTFEACAYALGILESKNIEEEMMKFFDIFVKQTLIARKVLFE